MCVCACVCCVPAMKHEWRSENSVWESILSFHYGGAGDHIWVIMLGGMFLFQVRHPTDTYGKKLEEFLYKEIRILSHKAMVSSWKNFKIMN